ncbi:MAG TPA: Uma2 family endonuclease [Chthonomonadaceae bacterium]|nr:Uma2 family endonuclease [Chthonomonadaceae bacterium]
MVSQAQQRKRYYTPEEYLALERDAEFKSEYLDGQIYAMSGGSPEHNSIAVNVASELRTQLKDKPCRVFSSDMKVRTSLLGLYSYPDVTVVCGAMRFHDEHRDVLTNPTLIVEVLSPSTEAFDRGKKFANYQRIASLTDYVLIAQDEARIDHYVRQPDDQWLLSSAVGLDAKLVLVSIGCTLLLSEVYDKVELPPLPTEEFATEER